ncbi:MAG: response regulator transcription factor [Chloroflexota bacterium]
MPQTVLIIEDESRILHWVRQYFDLAGFSTRVAQDGDTGLSLARQIAPDLIVLDLMLPGTDGQTICKLLRQESDVPIIILTARGEEDDRLAGFDLGADDYVVKPFSARELVARAEALLRRSGNRVQTRLTAGRIVLDTAAYRCWVGDEDIHLSRTQFTILEMLMRHSGHVLSRQQLMAAAYDDIALNYDRAIDTQIRRLRGQIEPDPRNPVYIQTVYGVGYRFVIPDDDKN